MTIPEEGAIGAAAEATKEVAKTVGKAIDALSQFGEFLGEIVGYPAKEAAGLVGDRLRYWRMDRCVRFAAQYRNRVTALGWTGRTIPAPPSIALPMIEQASIESDDSLQDLWVNLLVTATRPNGAWWMKRSFVDLLKQIDPIDAQILARLYAYGESHARDNWWKAHTCEERIESLEKTGEYQCSHKCPDDLQPNAADCWQDLHTLASGWVGQPIPGLPDDSESRRQLVVVSVLNLRRLACVTTITGRASTGGQDVEPTFAKRHRTLSSQHARLTELGFLFVLAAITNPGIPPPLH